MVPLLIYYLNMEKITKCRPLGKNSKQSYIVGKCRERKKFWGITKNTQINEILGP